MLMGSMVGMILRPVLLLFRLVQGFDLLRTHMLLGSVPPIEEHSTT